MNAAHTTSMVVDNGEFFVAHLDNGGIRIGMNNLRSFDFPAGSPSFGRIAAIKTAEAAEVAFDELMNGTV